MKLMPIMMIALGVLILNPQHSHAQDDDAFFDGPGDLVFNTYNSFPSYSFSTPGVYYIRVGENKGSNDYGGELVAHATYHLHVSSVPIPSAVWLLGSGIIGEN